MEKKCSSLSIILPSLDPPGSKCKLHRPFAFTKGRLRYEQVESYLTVVEPFVTLPRLLVPSRRVAYKAPTMRYGWRAPRDFLLEYARGHKLVKKWERGLYDCECMERALAAICKECGACTPSDLLGLQSTLLGSMESSSLIVQVYSNFDLKRRDLPSEDEIELVRQALDLKGPPRWFLDGTDWRWSRW